MAQTEAGSIITRTLFIRPGKQDLLLQVASGNGKVTINDELAILEQDNGQVIAVSMKGGSKGTSWNADTEGAIRLRIPASKNSSTLKLLHWRGENGKINTFSDSLTKNLTSPEDLSQFIKGGPTRWPHLL